MSIAPWTIATLGPRGTDSHAVAVTLAPEVELYATFRDAMNRSLGGDAVALVPCGAGPALGVAGDRWVDLNFEYCDRLVIGGVLHLPTKTMCIARHHGTGAPRAILLHPATEALALRYAPGHTRIYAASKVEAVERCAAGEAELCIGSLDVVKSFAALQPETLVKPTMVWTLFCRAELAPDVARVGRAAAEIRR